jgi:hypothetical protein
MSIWIDCLSQGSSKVNTVTVPKKCRDWSLLGEFAKIEDDVEETPKLKATTLWDFPRQSYGKAPKGYNKRAR